jgi:ATP/maltotriose-dependent transcriptional regulator MalT
MTPPRSRAKALERGHESLRNHAWGEAFAQLSAADRAAPLDPGTLRQLAIVAYLTGRDADGSEILARAHSSFLSQGDKRRAAQCAFWMGFRALNVGEPAQASGWLARCRRLLQGENACVEHGYLFLPEGIRSFRDGETAAAFEAFAQAAKIGDHFRDRELVTLALQGQGRALIRQGEIKRGVALLDEAMVAVTAGEVSPITAGAVYCSVIESCGETFDLRRAQEWTAALNDWCESQPDVVPYRGNCLLHRAEILQLRGSWAAALEEARQARERFSKPTAKPAVGAAWHRMAEIHRLRGEFQDAEEAYREANRWGRTAQPGFALLRLAEGQLDAGKAAIRRLTDEAHEPADRFRILEANVEIALAAGDLPAAEKVARELSGTAKRHGAPLLQAASARATGAVLLAKGDARKALNTLRKSFSISSELETPYEAARARVLIGLACRQRGDQDTAELELTAAREIFKDLGAAPDLAYVDSLLQKKRPESAGPLTKREVEVLKLVASGMTNRRIAARLFISEKTVARHLNNIFNKLDLPSRSAATAYAYQHDLA